MKKKVMLILVLLVLVSLVYAQSSPPGGFQPFSRSASSTTTQDPVQTTDEEKKTEPVVETPKPVENSTNNKVIDNRLNDLESRVDVLEKESGFNWFYLIIIPIIITISIGIYLFFKKKTQKMIKTNNIPESVKVYVKNNLQKGYTQSQIKQQLVARGWSPEQTNQLFNEVNHGF